MFLKRCWPALYWRCVALKIVAKEVLYVFCFVYGYFIGFLRGGVQGEGVTGEPLRIPAGKIGEP